MSIATDDLVEHLGGAASLDRVARRRLELAASALRTIGELGYARSSLREIAANSDFSHGVVHYYFRDKIDLIAFSVRVYKIECAKRYDAIVESATTSTGLTDGVGVEMTSTLLNELPLHRLWYDLRNQSMFEAGLREGVLEIERLLQQMIWRIVCRYAELRGRDVNVDAPTAYALIDGLFHQAVLRTAADPQAAGEELATRFRRTLPLILAG